ncbi:polyketide cyclase [Streptomyces spectabilis]|uniref:Polyketide cyclase n=1 Tax=Streptomyces spectabilis TaxID=68270 RepID=A0A5P2XM08_STRST|nr:polyketide cyclase [Streptomyces spectabilis]
MAARHGRVLRQDPRPPAPALRPAADRENRVNRHDIRLSGTWRAPLAPDTVYAKLADVGNYPAWWPAFRSVRRTGERECEVVIRSALPYALRATLTAVAEDPVAHVLEAALDGDISGSVRWVVAPDGHHGCVATLTQYVTVRKAALRRWMPLARPVFRVNHALAVRGGQRALTALARRSR